jgi:hypothetical protein
MPCMQLMGSSIRPLNNDALFPIKFINTLSWETSYCPLDVNIRTSSCIGSGLCFLVILDLTHNCNGCRNVTAARIRRTMCTCNNNEITVINIIILIMYLYFIIFIMWIRLSNKRACLIYIVTDLTLNYNK